MAATEELPSSKLGTKKHWDDTYKAELVEFERRGDMGEVWFGEESEERVIDWLVEHWVPDPRLCPVAAQDQHHWKKSLAVLDLGTGNGHFLMELAEFGFSDMTGVDYSSHSVALARAAVCASGKNIHFEQADLVKPSLPPTLQRQFAVCHDKGTYDAISLTPHTAGHDRIAYLRNVHRLLLPEGVFVITSCNWTEDELLLQCHEYFEKLHLIPTPSFMFGGKTGSLVTSLVLQKKSDMSHSVDDANIL
ncbi:Protein-lysine N-methyltransferase Efm4 [Trinorchestia longiramus]|nr:Protein-lysine N-methyltransferase Efm4 [Trinorchestia longiramus]